MIEVERSFLHLWHRAKVVLLPCVRWSTPESSQSRWAVLENSRLFPKENPSSLKRSFRALLWNSLWASSGQQRSVSWSDFYSQAALSRGKAAQEPHRTAVVRAMWSCRIHQKVDMIFQMCISVRAKPVPQYPPMSSLRPSIKGSVSRGMQCLTFQF